MDFLAELWASWLNGREKTWRAPFSVIGAAALLCGIGGARVTFLGFGQSVPPSSFFTFGFRGFQSRERLSGAVMFTVWAPQLLLGIRRIPLRSVLGLTLLSPLTVVHFLVGWEYGVSYHGWLAMLGMLAANIGALVVFWSLLHASTKYRSFWWNVLFHFGVCAWLIIVAFPDIIEIT